MHPRTTMTLLALALGLTAWAAIVEQSSPGAFEPPGRVFSGLEPSDILRMEIVYGGEDARRRTGGASPAIRMERRGEHDWWLTKPVEFPGFLPRIQGLTWSIVDLVQVERLSSGSEAYGKAIPEEGADITVRFWTRQGRERTIEIGRDHPVPAMEYVYVRIDGEDVHVTRKDIRPTFSVGLDDLRSRALVPIAPIDATFLSIEPSPRAPSESSQKTLARGGETESWTFRAPAELEGVLADRELMDELLLELNGWKIEKYVEDDAADLARYGLSKPSFRIHGRHQNGTDVRLEVGDTFEEDGRKLVHVRHAGQPFVFSADAGLLARLRVPAEDLRTRTVFDFRGVEVDRVVCRGAAGAFTLERRRAPEGRAPGSGAGAAPSLPPAADEWVVRESDEGPEHAADRHLVGVALADLRDLIIQKFLPPPDTESGYDTTVAVTLRTGEERVLRIGPRSDDPRDAGLPVYRCLRSTDPSHFLVETAWPERAEQGVHSLRERSLSNLQAPQVYELEVAAGDSRWRIGRPGDEWMFSEAEDVAPGKELDAALLDDLVRLLDSDRFRVREFAPGLPSEDWDLWGIGRRSYRFQVALTVVDGDAPAFRTLTVGHRKPESDPPLYYARLDTQAVPFVLDAAIPAKLEALVDHLRAVTGKP